MTIEWTDKTWNPLRGCSRISPGCENCYAEQIAARFSGPLLPFQGYAKRNKRGLARWTGRVGLVREKLREPLTWAEPRLCFVNSMSDLFHGRASDEAIAAIFGIMAASPRHTFQVLTKRTARAVDWFEAIGDKDQVMACLRAVTMFGGWRGRPLDWTGAPRTWPLSNVWLGASIENREELRRLHQLRRCPAAFRFLSVEPLLEGVRMLRADLSGIDLVIVGGESGPGARPCSTEWIKFIIDDCDAAGVPVFVKQLGTVLGRRFKGAGRRGQHMEAWPKELRRRNLPESLQCLLANATASGRSRSAPRESQRRT